MGFDRRAFCYGVVGLPGALAAARLSAGLLGGGDAVGGARVWDGRGEVRFVLRDHLLHPFYWWPRTLLSYPVRFLGGGLDSAESLTKLVLARVDTNEIVAVQFSEVVVSGGKVESATVNFFCDLPSGGVREFLLTQRETAMAVTPGVREIGEGDSIVLDTGVMAVRIPASRVVVGDGHDVPGPLIQVSRSGQVSRGGIESGGTKKWVGGSTLRIDGDRIARIVTTKLESGPLFVIYEIRYETEGGQRYAARVQCCAGTDFVRLTEDMEGLRAGASGLMVMDWSGFGVTHRQAPNHPFPLPDEVRKYEDYGWERIGDRWRSTDVINGSSIPIYPYEFPAGQVPFTLGNYQTWTAFYIATYANFWDERGGDALGVFIDKGEEWVDHEYAYELESPTLQVRFYYEGGRLRWEWPMTRGRRSTCVAFYDHEKDKAAQRRMEEASRAVVVDGASYKVQINLSSHMQYLQNRYGTLDLNVVKDWVLEYPEDGRRRGVIFDMPVTTTGAEMERSIMTSDYISTLPLLGTRQNAGHGPIPGRNIVNFGPVPSRRILGTWVGDFNRLHATLTDAQRRRLTAVFLMVAYVHAGEDFMPMVPMLSGHPNFLADVKATPAAMAFLFPDHPMAKSWAELWEKFVELNTRYNTRPAVKAWDAAGGRWTENLGTYVWAFLRPALRTEYLLRRFDGGERFLSPQLALMAEWLVGALTAPFDGESVEGYKLMAGSDGGREWGVVAPGAGPRRVYPPQGAHAERRTPPRSLWYLGNLLRQYAPMAAEHAMWAARPTDVEMENATGSREVWDVMYAGVKDNRGTDPHLRSAKYTGYGIVMRAGVGTREEVSIHLQQIDLGPNYRWGRPAEGGCGTIYFFAGGKAYSHNGPEDVGDRVGQDTDFSCNFGVWKDGMFHAIGENDLQRPFYNLGVGQFAELVPRTGDGSYCTPEYLSRSVMLAGRDYFLVHDAVLDQELVHRLAWFVRLGDELPTIVRVRGDVAGPSQRTEITDASTHGIWMDGRGDSMAVVSDRKDLVVTAEGFGCRVKVGGGEDLVFRGQKTVNYIDGDDIFWGTAGLIRKRDGMVEFAMFHGRRIGAGGVVIETEDTELGIGGRVVAGGVISGKYFAPQASRVRLKMGGMSAKSRIYIDGAAASVRRDGEWMVVELAAGEHSWEVTEGLPVPMAPKILRTENVAGGAKVMMGVVAGAEKYRVEMSKDGGGSWVSVGETAGTEFVVSGLVDGEKVHVRAVAVNAMRESAAGDEYPIYITSVAPLPPDGLHVLLGAGEARITWGEVLGVSEYRLYVRARGEREFRPLYRGREREYLDRRAGIRGCDAVPGRPNVLKAETIFEYTVAAVNGNGEGVMSRTADTDPAAWRNWDPKPGERFRRVYSYVPGTAERAGELERYYPE